MSKVVSIFPADNFAVVAESAGKEIEIGICIGYNEIGDLVIYGGGLLDGRRPDASDWLLIIEKFKFNMMRGDYTED